MECEIHPTLDSFEQQDAEANHPNFTVIRSAFKSSGGRDVYSPCIAVAAGDRSERTEEGIRYSTAAAAASIFLISYAGCSTAAAAADQRKCYPLSPKAGYCNNSLKSRRDFLLVGGPLAR